MFGKGRITPRRPRTLEAKDEIRQGAKNKLVDNHLEQKTGESSLPHLAKLMIISWTGT